MVYVEAAIVGIVAGGTYALLGVGITLMYRTTGVLSFANAAFAMVAAYVYTDLANEQRWPVGLAALTGVVVAVACGLLVEKLAARRVAHAEAEVQMIVTLGVLSLASGAMLLLYGFRPSPAPLLLPDRFIKVGSVGVGYQQLALLALALVAAGGLRLFLARSRFGLAIRAVAQDSDVASLLGMRSSRVAAFNWGLGALLSGAAGVLVAPLVLLSVASFPLLLVKALGAALVGGLSSIGVTLGGGLGIGALEAVASIRFSAPGTREAAILVLVVIVLLVRRTWQPDHRSAVAVPVSTPTVLPAVLARQVAKLGALTRSVARGTLLPILVLGALVPIGSEYWGFVGARALFYVIEALSLVLLVGWGGQVSLMNGAYVGVGAFLTAHFVDRGMPLELALVAAGLVGTVLGLLAVLPALRLSGIQFAIASLVFSAAASQWLFQRAPFADLSSGQLPRGTFLGVDLADSSQLYLVMLGVTAVAFLAAWNLRRSTYGAVLLACRAAPTVVEHFGTSAARVRTATFLFASFMATIGGGFFAVLVTSFTAAEFSVQLSISLLLYAVVGGTRSLLGPILAGVVFGVLPELLQSGSDAGASAWPDLLSGGIILVMVAASPGGLAGLLQRGRQTRRTLAQVFGASRFERAARRAASAPGEGAADAPVTPAVTANVVTS